MWGFDPENTPLCGDVRRGVLFQGGGMKTALLIDGGYLRAAAKATAKGYDIVFIEKFAHKCLDKSEYLFRVLYYDAPEYNGSAQKPVSGKWTKFTANDQWLTNLAKLERFAVRRGTIGFRGWKPKNIPIAGGQALKDSDFSPVFEQKGVDMRVGLDIAALSDGRSVERIVLVSGDTDMIPAMKHARKAGVEVVLIQLPPPMRVPHDGLLAHADLVRTVPLP